MAKKVLEAEIVQDVEVSLPFPIFTPVSQLRTINYLLYGKPGVGKTVLAGSAAEVEDMYPCLYADVEGGVISLIDFGYNASCTKVVQEDGFVEGMGKIYEVLTGENNYFKSLVVDSCTEMQVYCMMDIMAEAKACDSNVDINSPHIKHWGKNAAYMREWIRNFKELPIHLICTCLESENKDERTGEITIGPALPGKLASEWPGFFDVVGRLTISGSSDEPERLLHVQPTGKFMAKDRTNKLGRVVINPTMTDIYNTIKEAR